MRPVEKGGAPIVYTDYGSARHDLADVIGYYCSYCEMGVTNMIEVEHIHPVENGGNELDWGNFLLSCKYCNTVKSNNNTSRVGYFWADVDNTDLCFEYSEINVIQPIGSLSAANKTIALSTIDLTGLDRIPDGVNDPTEADTRWRSRKEVWDLVKKEYNDWIEVPIPQMARSIARTSLKGHYSIWIEVFKDVPLVLTEIDRIYSNIGLYKSFLSNGDREIRVNGNI